MTREEMEVRRLAAGDALRAGMSPAAVARRFVVTRTTTTRWRRLTARPDGLARTKATGRPPKLKWELVAALVRRRRGGWLRERHVGRALSEAIEKEFGVRYTSDHALRIAKAVAPELFPRGQYWRSRKAAAN